ncbi:MFS transporter [Solwaraspora sp. WMMD406]|uniref:MFS transporter n=1 Tax=Solwaraspora sp. WMMD406 TaxID=3016095 RepID=UPI002415C1A3|nr:MFS transporter [Solwaraspora sp. WMMD406]MDG4768461.1 MFS transporter [Solwaraspora sp. WMMD406]
MARTANRCAALVLAVLVTAVASISWPMLAAAPAQAAPIGPLPAQAANDLCSVEAWQADFRSCLDRLQGVSAARAQCLKPPAPSAPDSGFGGWFATQPEQVDGPIGLYTTYGYAGYRFPTYDLDGGCASGVVNADVSAFNGVANFEMMVATAIIGASNAIRERAWDPGTMYAWADPLVEQATTAIYEEVFTVFGLITICVVGLYLIWRSRQSDMSNMITTAGWAVLIMVVVTAIAAWPVRSANLADGALTSTLGVVHEAVGPRAVELPAEDCLDEDEEQCADQRPPAVRASDTITSSMLYRNWLRGVLGSADSPTAQKYGYALYDAQAFSWFEIETIRADPERREAIIAQKNRQWMVVAEQIRTEDPEAYEHLQGVRDMDRVGTGLIAIFAAVMFAMFDLAASLLVLLGFLLFRWVVVAAPILGTIGLLRPAGAGMRRLGNAVVAAIFNIAIFGTGAAVYLFAVDLIMSTPTLPGWLQVVLIWLCGMVGWLLLRPYRRITDLGGGSDRSGGNSWHIRYFRGSRETRESREPEQVVVKSKDRQGVTVTSQSTVRPEARLEDPSSDRPRTEETTTAPARERPDGRESGTDPAPEPATTRPASRPRRSPTWTPPDVPAEEQQYAVYRPDSARKRDEAPAPRIRSEAR